MAAQDQSNSSQVRKHFPWLRLVILFVALLLFIAAAIIWYVNVNWSSFLTIVFAVLGVALALVAWLFPISPDKPNASNTDTAPISPLSSISINVSPTISFSPNQNISLQSSPTEMSRPHNTVGVPLPIDSTRGLSDGNTITDGRNTIAEVRQLPHKEEGQSLPEPDSVFLFNVPLTDPAEFYGRARERAKLVNRTRRSASTSIVGPRRIGKTWLISYLILVAPHELGSHFRIGYLDAAMPSCSTVAGFTSKALEELGNIVIDSSNIGLDRLERVVKDLKSRNQIPVLCIDEFEGLSNRQAFDLNFFSELRAITQAGLILVVASKHRLIELVSDTLKTSPFFNVFEQLTLNPFSTKEAQEFAKAKANQAGFTEQEQDCLLKYGREEGEQQWFPLHLQLTGKMLLEDKREGSEHYHPDDPDYWWEFRKRSEETYRGVVP